MAIESRQAYIEFLSRDSFEIVTPYRRKLFQLKESDDLCYIDLITLKKSQSEKDKGNFYIVIDWDFDADLDDWSKNEVIVRLDVNVKVRANKYDEIGEVTLSNSPRTFRVKYDV